MPKLQNVKDKIVRHTPMVLAVAGGTGIGAYLMYRHMDMDAHFIKVHSGICGHLRATGEEFLFNTPAHGSFVLAPVVQV